MVEERPRYINLVVLLRIACETTATVLLAAYLTERMGLDRWPDAAAAIMVVTSFVVGVGPRTLGRQNAYSISLAAALPLHAISVLLTPISRLLILLGNALTPGRGFRNGPFASEIELREVVDLAQQRGVVADDERRMIQSVFELGDTPAREGDGAAHRDGLDRGRQERRPGHPLAVRSGHFPDPGDRRERRRYRRRGLSEGPGRPDVLSTNGGQDTPVGELMRPAVFVPDSKPLDDLLRDATHPQSHGTVGRRVRRHRRTGEYRGCARGDRGEIADEYTTPTRSPRPEACGRFGRRVLRVSSRLPIEDLGELYDGSSTTTWTSTPSAA